MKRIITLTAAMALLAGAGLASAADLPGSLKDSNNTVISPIQGLYGEVAVGYGYSQGQTVGFASAGADLAATGTLFNMRAGFDKINLAGKFGAGIYAEGSNAFNVSGGISGLGRLSEHWSYGSGVKGKINHSMSHGLPVVATIPADDPIADPAKLSRDRRRIRRILLAIGLILIVACPLTAVWGIAGF